MSSDCANRAIRQCSRNTTYIHPGTTTYLLSIPTYQGLNLTSLATRTSSQQGVCVSLHTYMLLCEHACPSLCPRDLKRDRAPNYREREREKEYVITWWLHYASRRNISPSWNSAWDSGWIYNELCIYNSADSLKSSTAAAVGNICVFYFLFLFFKICLEKTVFLGDKRRWGQK